MDFDLDPDQRQLRDEARRFLERETPISYARSMFDDARGFDEKMWKQMAALGWPALPFEEDLGGLGLGFIALSLLVAEMGRVVLPGPYLSTMIAGLTIAAHGSDEQRARTVPQIANGDLFATLCADGAMTERGGALDGVGRFVLDATNAQCIVVSARNDDGGAALFLADAAALTTPGAREAVQTMDQTRRTAHVRFTATPAKRLGTSDAAAVQHARDMASVLLAAEMLGAAERVLEISTEYAKERVQFGRPIGSFQAVKHRLADMLVDVESMRNAVYYAAWAMERGTEDASLAASMAKACASDAASRVTKSGIQVHGGIGFTWEHDAHLYLKRVKFDEHCFGDATEHRERIANLLRARLG